MAICYPEYEGRLEQRQKLRYSICYCHDLFGCGKQFVYFTLPTQAPIYFTLPVGGIRRGINKAGLLHLKPLVGSFDLRGEVVEVESGNRAINLLMLQYRGREKY